MKLDPECIRHILLELEEKNPDSRQMTIKDFACDDYDEAHISGHLSLLLDAKYIEATPKRYIHVMYPEFMVNRMTYDGHNFLETIRDNSRWGKIKKSITDKGLPMTFEVILSVGSALLGK